MATMDDKILGEKLQYYYSSSDDERDDDDDDVKCSGEDADCGEGETSCQPDEDFTSGSATHVRLNTVSIHPKKKKERKSFMLSRVQLST